MKNRSIPLPKTAKFPGLNWDSKLERKEHINKLKAKCSKDLNLMRSITTSDSGADQKTLMRIYRMIIRPKIDYGCILYGAAQEEQLKSLETMINEAMRIS